MASRGGFSLVEIVVVMIIVGALAAIALPNYFAYNEQTKVQTAENVLNAISAGQQKYYEDWGGYCTNNVGVGNNPTPPFCGDNATDLSSHLKLNLSSNDPFFPNYSCDVIIAPYRCTTHDGTYALTLAANAAGTGFSVTCNPACP